MVVQRDLCQRLCHSPELRQLWAEYRRLIGRQATIAASLKGLTPERISQGRCWGCLPTTEGDLQGER